MIRVVLSGLAILPWLCLTPASHAQAAGEAPSCQAVYGDVWGEEKQELNTREVDGDTLKSLEQLHAGRLIRELGDRIRLASHSTSPQRQTEYLTRWMRSVCEFWDSDDETARIRSEISQFAAIMKQRQLPFQKLDRSNQT